MKRLQTFDAVVEQLGGLANAARTCRRGMPQLCYWRKTTGRFPARFYPRITKALAKGCCEASDEVFDFERDEADAA
jgi:hypothetical protein